ncbi:IucA/IucC family protein [Acinetobacter colistiniresistens]|uniref:Siderophore biosynthesis protein n=2 Tax=Acinetobacter colistiniresistens TaxID=280145 RepID=A0A558F7Q0_9GAMM|nr:IucA/IucC family protein [Acinetobacter colistiniresistens]TVT81634.1 siderophore biosynthesis protein [Acinetobacter colistiniresistens]
MLDRIYTVQLQKTIDALYMENYGEFRSHISYKKPYLVLSLNNELQLYFHCLKVNRVNPFHITKAEVLLHSIAKDTSSKIAISEIFTYLTQAFWWPSKYTQKAIDYWHDNLVTAEKIPQLLEEVLSYSSPLLIGEQLSLIADRPFHPFAHAKGELTTLINQKEIEVYWWAFKNVDVINNMQSIPSDELQLSTQEKKLINEKIRMDLNNYIALPLLKTQHDYLQFKENKYQGINLNHTTTIGAPTSSLRTLVHHANPNLHLKLSTNAKTLGAIRSMPARYLANGHAAFDFLNTVINLTPSLKQHLVLSNETHWWALGKQEPLVKNLGVIGCQIRHLPDFCQDNTITPITMSALSCPYVDPWKALGIEADRWSLLKELSTNFIHTFLTLWSFGVMPECHGQNTIVCYQNHKFKCFVLRDHDTLRICTPTIQESGFIPPNYTIDTSTPNNLIFNKNEDLLNYFITLGIQINLYPVALATLKYTDHSEHDFWEMIQQVIKDFLETKPISQSSKNCIEKYIFENRTWPFKQLLTPLLAEESDSTGMPSKIGVTPNPYHALLFSRFEIMDS